jgi:amino acid adenylation domain-containing protein/non-ribosomal peptide synthase protein (TIGR01720 family)
MDDLSSRLASLSPAKRALLQKMLEKPRGRADAIPRRPSGAAPLLSFAQQRLWFLDQLEGPSATYNMPSAFRLSGPLDVDVLERAIREIVRRHEVLRTNFTQVDGTPVAVVHDGTDGYVSRIDLTAFDAVSREAEIVRRATEAARLPFDLARDRLLRVTVLCFSSDLHVMLVNMHHIVSDGWSLGVIVKEMLTLYTAMVKGEDSPVPELPIQYGDFACWQREWLSGRHLDRQIDFWKQHLAGAPALLALPTDRPRPPVQTFRGSTYAFTLDGDRLKAMTALSRSTGASLFMVLCAAFAAVLSRYSRQDDFVIGTPVANRLRQELEPLVGFFVNTLALRMDLSGDPTAANLIQRVKDASLGAFRNQDVPFERLVEELQPARQLGFSPIFQVMFILQNAPLDDVRLPGVEFEEIAVDAGSSMFDLTMKLRERGGVLEGELEFNTDLFDKDTIERLVGHYGSMLDGMAGAAAMPVSRVPLLSEGERTAVVQRWNVTAAPLVANTVIDLFEQQAARTPDRIALAVADQQFDYRSLDDRSARLAAHLQSLGIGPETPVGMCVPRSFEMVVGLLGILKSGGAYVPLDPAFPKERLALMVDNSRLPVIVTTTDAAPLLPDCAAIRVYLDADWDRIAAAPPARRMTASPEQLAYVIYTSGSTGTPKGVQISHGALANFLESMRREPGLGQDDVLMAVTTISFDIAALELFLPLIVGARVVIAPQETAADGFKLVAALRASGANVMQATPATWQMLLATDWDGAPLTRCFCGGEALSRDLASQLLGKGLEVWNLYGPTETAIWSAIAPVGSSGSPELPHDAKEPIGRPIANTQIYIVDKHLQPVPVGVPGELCIAGAGLARGYFRRPDLTAAVFVPNPFGPAGSRMYRTGDLCRYRADGRIEFIGRVDHQIKLRGYRIELGEIEAVIDEHPAVRNSVVMCREDHPGAQQLVAYIQRDTAAASTSIDRDALAGGQVDKWRTVWDDIYARGSNDRDDTFDTSGWISSYTGQRIPDADMRAWLDETVARILALSPRRVMEIGCGTGMVLHHVAPHVEAFTGVDISESVLARLRASVSRRGLANVTLKRAHADDAVDPSAYRSFNAVVLNSVIQYFPSADYLITVLEAAVDAVEDDGAIFLGDVRSLPLASLFRAAVEFHRAEDDVPLEELSRRVAAASEREEELLLAPEFFTALRARIPRISAVDVQVKRHAAATEMSKFRYDVVLRIGPPAAIAAPAIARVDGSQLGRDALRQHLESTAAETVLVAGLLNRRVAGDAAVLQALGDARGNVGTLRARIAAAGPAGVDPVDIWNVGEALGFSVSVRGSSTEPDRLEALFHRGNDGRSASQIHALMTGSDASVSPQHHANEPVRTVADRIVIAELRKTLTSRLPGYMQPASIVCLDQFPLTPNGKVNRALLPAPDVVSDDRRYIAPSTDLERQLAEIWSEVLDVPRVGIGDNFFELGGHSLLAMQLISRVRERCAVELPIQALFDAPRLGELAARLQSDAVSRRTLLPPITAIDRKPGGTLPLSFAQQRLWFLDQLEGTGTTYNLSGAVRFDGALNVKALTAAFSDVERRHEALRSNFVQRDGHPVVVVAPPGRFALAAMDVEGLDEGDQQDAIDRVIATEAARPFDLARDCLWRATLIRCRRTAHVLVMSIHHIVSDEWSMGVLIHELSTLYAAHERGAAASLPALSIQYADYAAWQRSWLGDRVLDAQRQFWRSELDGAPALLALPTDRPRPQLQRHRGRVRAFDIDREVADRLTALGKASDATLFMTLLAGYAILLHRYTGAEDIVIGSPVANRVRPELESLIGFFVNTLPFRIDLSGEPTIAQLIGRVRRAALSAYGNQDVPFEQLVEELRPERNLGHAPIFQVMFVLQNVPPPDLRQTSLEISSVPPSAVSSKFDLTFSVAPSDRGLTVLAEYDSDLFDESTIERLAAHFRNLLASMSVDADRRVRDLPMLDASERRQVIDGFNDATADVPSEPNVVRMFERYAARTPDAPAVRDGIDAVDYAELNQRAENIAASLRAFGVGPDVTVGICLRRRVDSIASALAVLKAGGCYVPLDPASPEQRLRHMIGETRMAVVITSRDVKERLPGIAPILVIEDIAKAEATPPAVVDANNLAYVIYTSGSTGLPKGVAVSYGNLARAIAARRRVYDEPMSALFSPLSLAFDAGNGAIFWALCQGACLVLGPDDASQPNELVRRLSESRCSHLIVGPALYGSMLELATAPQLDTLRNVVVGGEALAQALVARHAARVPHARLFNEYGPTEATWWSAVSHVSLEPGVVPDIGSGIPGTRLYVLDRNLDPVPIGVVGELCIGGGQVARGYLDHPGVTAERFIPDPFGQDAGGRLYRTGDLVKRRDNGALEFIGRADNQVKIRGFRVELGEIESAIAGHAGVAAAAVVVHADQSTSARRLVAYCVRSGEAAVDGADLQTWLKARVPAHMVPSQYAFLSELPLTANGKVDRRALPAIDAHGAADQHVAPRTPTEQLLAGIWQDVLGLDRVGVRDNFFELGGDSILSIQIVSRANRAGLGVTIRQLFECQTIETLARVAPERRVVRAEQGVVTGAMPLTPIQHWFFDGRSPEPHHCNQLVLLLAATRLDADRVHSAVRQLLWHHDALRSRFDLTSDPPAARIAEVDTVTPLAVCDLSGLPVAEARAAITADAERRQRSLNLIDGPIVAAVLYRMGDGEPDRLLLVIHHLAVDGVSWRILIEDFATAYTQLLNGQPVTLPEKTTSFREWAERLRDYAASTALTAEASYWRDLSSVPVTPLPRDRAVDDAENTSASAEDVSIRLSPASTHALLTAVPAAYRTQINDALLAALTRSLSKWTGGDAVRIVLEGHGREALFDDVDLARTVGVFTSFYPIVLSRVAGEHPGATLARTKETLRAVPARGLGFGLLTYMNAAAGLPRHRAAEISFNYLGRFDGDGRGQVFAGVAGESAGSTQSAAGLRRYILDINGILNDSALEFHFTFSRNLHERSTIQAVADDFLRELEGLVAHCLERNTGGYTASDFPLAKASETTLAQLFERWGRGVDDAYALAPMQQGMVFHSLFEDHTGVDIIQLSCVLEGDVQPEEFQRAWQQVIDRHPALRTAFLAGDGGDPIQVVVDRAQMPWHVADWRDGAADDRAARLTEFLRADRVRGFTIDEPPMMRGALLQFDRARWQFVWTHHHLLTDGWCLPILLNEAMAIYEGTLARQPVTLPAARPFRDYIAWLARQDRESAREFWRASLEGFAAPTRLGIDRGPGIGDTARRFGTVSVELSTQTTHALQQLAQSRRVTLSIVVQAAWAVLLGRYAGTSDVVFGATVSGRPPELAGVDSMIGLFINTLPVRVSIDEAETVAALLARLQDGQVRRDAHAHTPLIDIQSCSEVAAPDPLFESIVVFENYPMDKTLGQPGGAFSVSDFELFEQTNLPITLMTAPAERLPLRIAFDEDRFDRIDVDRLLEHLSALLEGVSAGADRPVGNWAATDDPAQRRLLEQVNDTSSTFADQATTFADLFERQAARVPANVAAIAGDARINYETLNRRANQLARRLRNLGVRPGERVGVFIDRSLDMLTALVAINKAAAAYVPIDPSFPADRVAHMLNDSGAKLVLAQPALADTVPSSNARVVMMDEAAEATCAHDNLGLPVHASSAAYVIYTSGSTGVPKGVTVPNGALVNLLQSMRQRPGLSGQDVLLAVTTISFDIAALELFLPLITGATVVIADRDTARDGSALLEQMQRTRATVMQATPMTWRLLLEAGWNGAPLTRALCGGEALPRELSTRLLATGIELWNVYGPTETTIWSGAHRVGDDGAVEVNEPIGRPIHNTQFYVVDRSLRLVPPGVPGELLIGGEGLALGYAGRGDLTAEKFVPDSFGGAPGARLYRTGDLVRHRADGVVVFLGRLDSQVKVRGFRIELGEIEAALDQQAGVKQSAVLVRQAANGENELAAYIVARDEVTLDIEAIRASLTRTLPAYMVPARFVFLPQMPLTLNGKVNRRALPAPDDHAPRQRVAPRTQTESRLAEIWSDVFGIGEIGIDDNFFDLGGHSLLAAKAVGRIRTALKVALPMPVLFRQPTIRELGEHIDNMLWAAGQSARPASADEQDVEEVSL